MPVLTAEDTFSIGDVTDPIEESVQVTVISAPSYPTGKGRLSHPTLGTFDYEIAPTEWQNVGADMVIPPVWAHERTLTGNSSTLWKGYIGDLEAVERWIGSVVMRVSQFSMLVDMWQNPPESGQIVWTPNYANSHSYEVQMLSVSSGGSQGTTLDYTSLQREGFVKGPVEVVYKVLRKV
jgi:hypothetical protein